MTPNTADVATVARHLFETEGTRAIPHAAQKAAAFEEAGDADQAAFWRRIEGFLREMRGARQT